MIFLSKHLAASIKFILFAAATATILVLFSLYGIFRDSPKDLIKNTAVGNISDLPFTAVIIDAGHGGEDGGATAHGVVEKDVNLSISLMLADYFKMSMFDVYMTRTDDTLFYFPGQENRKKYYDISNRVDFAKKIDNAVFISIHQNKFEIEKYKGLQVYYSPNNILGKDVAEQIQNDAIQNLDPENNRKIKQADYRIRVLKELTIPAVLVECGFLSNEHEAELLASEEYQKKLAFSIFTSILDFCSNNT